MYLSQFRSHIRIWVGSVECLVARGGVESSGFSHSLPSTSPPSVTLSLPPSSTDPTSHVDPPSGVKKATCPGATATSDKFGHRQPESRPLSATLTSDTLAVVTTTSRVHIFSVAQNSFNNIQLMHSRALCEAHQVFWTLNNVEYQSLYWILNAVLCDLI